MAKATRITYTLIEGEKVLAEFNANNTDGFLCFYKVFNEANVVITNRRVIAITKLGTRFLNACCGGFGAVITSYKECLVSGLSGFNSYSSAEAGFCCLRRKIFTVTIGSKDGNSISFCPNIKNDDEAQAILDKIAEITEQVK